MKVIKLFGFGLLYAILLPFILVAAAVFAVYGFAKSIVYFFVVIIRFFKGEKLFAPYPEDVEAAKRIRAKLSADAAEPNATQPQQPGNVYVQPNYYTNPAMQGQQPGPAVPPPNPYYQQQGGYGPGIPPYQQQPQPGYIGNEQMPNQQIPQNPYAQQPGYNPNPQPDFSSQPIDLNAEEQPTVTMIEAQGGENNDQ